MSSQPLGAAAHALVSLPPEPWGRRMRRAREDVSRMSLEDAVDSIAHYTLTSTATISRLESLEDAPLQRSRREVAYIACIVYGVNPSDLDLDAGDVPPGVSAVLDRRRYKRSDVRKRSSRCISLLVAA